MSIEDKFKELLEASVALDRAFIVAGQELRTATNNTPHLRTTLERLVTMSVQRNRYDVTLERLVKDAAEHGYLDAEFIQRVIDDLRPKREAIAELNSQLQLAGGENRCGCATCVANRARVAEVTN